MTQNYLYLVRQKDHSKFKIGVTSNPRARSKQYQTHSLDVEYIGHIEVPNRDFEKRLHRELLIRNFIKCSTLGKTEWFNGTINYKEFINMVDIVVARYNDFIKKHGGLL